MFRKSFVIAGLGVGLILLTASRLEVAATRCEPRRAEIESLLSQQGVSNSSYYYHLALAESTCRDEAVSKAGARSMWQMMPWLIGQRDPMDWREMTRVAGAYIASIERRLPPESEWLTVAAWNTGLHNMQQVCGKVPSEECVRNSLPQTAALADLVTDWTNSYVSDVD